MYTIIQLYKGSKNLFRNGLLISHSIERRRMWQEGPIKGIQALGALHCAESLKQSRQTYLENKKLIEKHCKQHIIAAQ